MGWLVFGAAVVLIGIGIACLALLIDKNSKSRGRVKHSSPKDELRSAMKVWYSKNATAWWSESSKTGSICDDCSRVLQRGEGYLRPRHHVACEECTEKMFSRTDWEEAKWDMNRYCGPSVPSHIEQLARRL